MLATTALIVSALVPGVYARWSSRHLLRHLEHPLLPERLAEHFRRVGSALGIVVFLGAVIDARLLPALLFLAWTSVLAGGFRARRVVFDESWSFTSYFAHTLRFWIGLVGSFALIAAIPWAMAPFGERALPVGIGVGGAGWLWVLLGPRAFLRLVRARPLEDPEVEALSPLFSRVLENAKCSAPELFVAEAPGGRWVNAFALPAVRRPGVLFTRGLLSALTHEEAAAIFAHEVAHLEHYRPRNVALGRALALLLAAIPVFLWAGPLAPFLRGWEWIWPLAVLIAFAASAGNRRAHEAESDRRALELFADPDSLVSGLVKLHSLNRLPRRWDRAFESRSTHPSLARRVRAIRAVSGKRVPEEVEAFFRAADGTDRAVLFDSFRIHWLRELPEDGKDLLARSGSRQSHRYEDLLELRLRGGRELVLKGRAGEMGVMAVRAEDVAAIEGVLDRVDALLGDASPDRAATSGALWSIVLGVFGLIPRTSWVLAALAGTALVRPSFIAFLALGSSGLASALAVPYPWWRSMTLALAGLASLIVAFRSRGRPRTRTEVLVATLVPLGLVVLSGLRGSSALLSSLPVMHLSLWASESPSAFVGLVTIGAVLASLPRTRARLCAVLAFAAALGLFWIASSAFRERFGGDLFAATGSPMPVTEASLTTIREVTIPGGASRLLLSPGGGIFAVALAPPDEDEDENKSAFLIESAPGRLESVRALALDYVDDERVLIVEKHESRFVLKEAKVSDLDSAVVIQDLPPLAGLDLDADVSGSWQVTGYDWAEGNLRLIRGGRERDVPDEIQFPLADDVPTLVSVNRNGVALLARYAVPEPALLALAVSPPLVMALELRESGGPAVTLGKSALSPQCFRSPLSESGFYCAASADDRTALFALPPGASSFEPLGFLPGTFYGNEVARGARLLFNSWDGPPLMVDLARRVACRPDGSDTRGAILAWQGNVLAAARVNVEGDETKVTLYTVAP